MLNQPLVALRGVSAQFGDRVLFDRLDFDLRAGDLVALTGPSGSGKSTLLGIVAGLLAPSAGKRLVGQTDADDVAISWVFQTSPLLSNRSVLENVAMGPLCQGRTFAEAIDASREPLRLMGLESRSGARAHSLSGGERQRLAVARSLATRSQVLLADEPTASLDRLNKEKMCDAFEAAAKSGVAVVVATHDPAVAGRCSSSLDLAG